MHARTLKQVMLFVIISSCATVALACGHRCWRGYWPCQAPPVCQPISIQPCMPMPVMPKIEIELLPMPRLADETTSLPGAWTMSDLVTGHPVLFPKMNFRETIPTPDWQPPIVINWPPVNNFPHDCHYPPIELPPTMATPVPPSLVLFGTGMGLLLASQVWRRWRTRFTAR